MTGRTVQRPSDLECSDANLHAGAVNGGTSGLFPQLVFRPVPKFGRAETPMERLHLGSAAATPSGEVHRECGRNPSRAAGRARREWTARQATATAEPDRHLHANPMTPAQNYQPGITCSQ
jgi:phytoene dehydrogenase-like protein